MISFRTHLANCDQYFRFIRNLLCNIYFQSLHFQSLVITRFCLIIWEHFIDITYSCKAKFDSCFAFFIDLGMSFLKVFYTKLAEFFALIPTHFIT